jgi:3-dehydroquinate synthase
MIGAFHQPQAVIADVDVFSSLPQREYAAGLAEVIKYGLIYDADFFIWLEQNMEQLVAKQDDAVIYAVKRSCEIKAEVVAQDEKESGIRAWLNLGHTFGHAIEAAQGYGSWLHGEAVAAGMVMALDLSQRLGWIAAQDQERAIRLIAAAGLPVAPPSMSAGQFLNLMAGDKKVLDGQLRLVLLNAIGKAVVTADFSQETLLQTLSAEY